MLDILKILKHPDVVPCRCGHAGCECGITEPGWFDADSDVGTHNLRFMLHEPAWPVRLDMDGSWVPFGVNPAPPEDLPNGFMPAESDEYAEDTVYSARAADDLVVGLGLDSAQPWLDRVTVRLDPDQGVWAPVCSAHTLVPFAVVAGHDLTWRGVEFGQVAVPGAIIVVCAIPRSRELAADVTVCKLAGPPMVAFLPWCATARLVAFLTGDVGPSDEPTRL